MKKHTFQKSVRKKPKQNDTINHFSTIRRLLKCLNLFSTLIYALSFTKV